MIERVLNWLVAVHCLSSFNGEESDVTSLKRLIWELCACNCCIGLRHRDSQNQA